MKINDVDINYIDYGNKKKDTILLLHGWGQNIEMMKGIGDKFADSYRIVIVDLPGYGSSSEPIYPWHVEDYALCIKKLIDNLKIKKLIIIGHSFGGKIGLLYSSMFEVEKLICLASPYKVKKKKENLKLRLLKIAKKIPLLNKLEGFAKKHIGSTDYKNASEMMRKILVNTVNTDITENVKKIKCPTLLIWGTLDTAAEIENAYELEKLINNCGVVVYDGCTHYAYLERFDQTIRVLKSFIGDGE